MIKKELISKGTYGEVYLCDKNGVDVAVKTQVFEDDYNAIEEITILMSLQPHDRICHFIGCTINRESSSIVMDYYKRTLYSYIPKCTRSREERLRIMLEIQSGLSYIHENEIIHGDLKPANILLDSDHHVRIADFGLSVRHTPNQPHSLVVCTLEYRAIEVLLGECMYDYAIDVWSLGCIFAELCTGRILFHGEDELEQLRLIVMRLGMPTFKPFITPIALSPTRRQIHINGLSLLEIDLLNAMLEVNPSLRILSKDIFGLSS
jgi:serine/threonine protein kinase